MAIPNLRGLLELNATVYTTNGSSFEEFRSGLLLHNNFLER